MKNYSNLFFTLFFAAAASTIFISCEVEHGKDGIDGINGIDGVDGKDTSVFLAASKSPNLLKVTGDFVNLKITLILTSEDVIPNTPDFAYFVKQKFKTFSWRIYIKRNRYC